jgi:DNA end-binding protein Ku
MPEHAIWNGCISFGSFAVVVKLHPAVRDKRIKFNLLHKRDLIRLQRQLVCSLEGAPVPPEDQARGFELEGGKYILVDPADLEATEPEASRAIEVHEFVPVADIDPVFLERSYFLEPGEGDREKAGLRDQEPKAKSQDADADAVRLDRASPVYAALVAALEEERLAGICTWTMRRRAYFGALVPDGRLLRLHTLRFPGEIIKASRPAAGEALSDRELAVGAELINHMSGSFKPEQFENSHEKRLQELINRKARGQQIHLVQSRRKAATAPNRLLAVLEASLKKVA